MSQTPEELEILAGMVDQINLFDNQLSQQMEKMPTVDNKVESTRIDKRQALTQLAKHGKPDAEKNVDPRTIPHPVDAGRGGSQYTPNPNDGFGELEGFAPSLQPQPFSQPRQPQPTTLQPQQSFESASLLPPTILTSILRKLISIEASVNKLVEKQKTADKT